MEWVGSTVATRWEGFLEKVGYILSFEWKRVGVMDSDSGDDGTDEFR